MYKGEKGEKREVTGKDAGEEDFPVMCVQTLLVGFGLDGWHCCGGVPDICAREVLGGGISGFGADGNFFWGFCRMGGGNSLGGGEERN